MLQQVLRVAFIHHCPLKYSVASEDILSKDQPVLNLRQNILCVILLMCRGNHLRSDSSGDIRFMAAAHVSKMPPAICDADTSWILR